MTDSLAPEMSVILVVPESCESVRKTLDHLRAQSARARLELIFVAPAAQAVRMPVAELKEFASVCLVEVAEFISAGHAKAVGIRRASAPIVAFAEDHSYPEAGWAEALIEDHKGLTAAVGPVLINANPNNAVSWASMYLDFGPVIAPAIGGQVGRLPWHNTSYRVDLLLNYGPDLPAMLDVEGILHADLRRKGYALYLEPKAMTRHLNFSLVSSFVKAQFYGGQLFAASQTKYYRWSWWQRLVRIAGAPLVPWLRLRRTIRDLIRSGRGRMFARIAPLLILGLVIHASGEFFGFAVGMGDALQERFVLEFHRERHIADIEEIAR